MVHKQGEDFTLIKNENVTKKVNAIKKHSLKLRRVATGIFLAARRNKENPTILFKSIHTPNNYWSVPILRS